MFLEVIYPGPATTIQDQGRPGFGAFGVAEGGAMDRGLLARANRLAGNRAGSAALEFALEGPRLLWRGRRRLHCIRAGDLLTAITLAPGDELNVGSLSRKAYGYLAVGGGLDVPRVMGGRGACLPGGFGGLYGRALRRGDRLPVGRAPTGVGTGGNPSHAAGGDDEADGSTSGAGPLVVRVLPGDRSGPRARSFRQLVAAEWRAAAGNRVGIQLDGPGIDMRPLHLSQPLPPGAIQVTGAGQPILLLRDHPTIGGYPVVAVVVAADLDACAQLRPAHRLRFVAG